MTSKTLIASALVLGLTTVGVQSADAAVIAAYDFNSASASATTEAANVNAQDVVSGPSAGNSAISFTSNRIEISNSDYEEAASVALANGQFVKFVVTADPGYELDLSGLTYKHARSNSAPRVVTVYASTDGFATSSIIDTDGNNNSSTLEQRSVILTGSPWQNLSQIEIRFVFHDDNSSPGVARYDDFILSGEVSLIPEPASLALLGLGGLCLLGGRRTRV